MNQISASIKAVSKLAAILFLLVSAAVFFLASQPIVILRGLASGTSAGLLAFWHLARTVRKAVKMTPSRAKAYAAAMYIARYIFMGAVLWISSVLGVKAFVACAGGIMIVKLSIYIAHLSGDAEFYKRIFKRGGKNGK